MGRFRLEMTAYQFGFLFVLIVYLGLGDGKQPNILLVLADDYGFHDIGYHGSNIKTPNLDNLARKGVKLENYYVQPVCTPTRSQLLSGRYQIHTGLQHGIIWPAQTNGLPLSDPTIADKLKEAGYSTHAVGKWHIGFYKKEYTPIYRGFDSYFGFLTGSGNYYTHHRCYGGFCGYDLISDMEPVTNANNSYSTHLFANKVIDIVEKHNTDQPLFIYLPFQAVHGPLQVPDSYIKPYMDITDRKRRVYAAPKRKAIYRILRSDLLSGSNQYRSEEKLYTYMTDNTVFPLYNAIHWDTKIMCVVRRESFYGGMVSCMDEAIGNVTEAMKRKGLWDNTVMIFSTDNGGDYRNGGYNWPLRGKKGTLWEGGVHGIGFIHGNILDDSVKGTVSNDLIHVTDWFPTLVTLGGGSLKGTSLDGYNQWNTINKNYVNPRKEILHNINPMKRVPKGAPFYGDGFNTSIRASLRVGDWKIITGNPGSGSWIPPPHLHLWPKRPSDNPNHVWLFNITADANEHNDLSKKYPDVVKQMLNRLQEYQNTAVPVRYPPNDPRCNPKLLGGYWGPWETHRKTPLLKPPTGPGKGGLNSEVVLILNVLILVLLLRLRAYKHVVRIIRSLFHSRFRSISLFLSVIVLYHLYM